MSESRKPKKFLPDGNISTRKESFQLRHVKVVSNCHSINVNKQVDGQFSRKCLVPGSEGSPAAHQPSIRTRFLVPGWSRTPALFHASLPPSRTLLLNQRSLHKRFQITTQQITYPPAHRSLRCGVRSIFYICGKQPIPITKTTNVLSDTPILSASCSCVQ